MKIISWIGILIIFASQACIDDYSLQLPYPNSKLVVDVLVSSVADESSITIGWTSADVSPCFYTGSCEDVHATGPYAVIGTVKITEEGGNTYTFPIRMKEKFYSISIKPNIAGTPGLSYFLDIEIQYKGQTSYYNSATVMFKTPPIDSVGYQMPTGSRIFKPLIYFHEPPGENFYLFKLCGVRFDYSGIPYSDCPGPNSWPYSIMTDDFLPEEVKGLIIDDGVDNTGQFTYPSAGGPTGAMVWMTSVTKETYEFYKSSLEQFNNDGGAFSPTPTTPRGNISGGALGLFRAHDVANGMIILP